MTIRLVCSDEHRAETEEIVRSCGMAISDDSAFLTVCERGKACDPASLVVLYDPEDLGALEALLSRLAPARADDSPSPSSGEVLLGRNGDCFEVIKVPQACYFRADGDFVYCVTPRGEFEVKKKLYQLERMFRDRGFIRIGKSLIVNILVVSEVVPWFGGRLLLRIAVLKDKVEVSRNYVRSFKTYLGM